MARVATVGIVLLLGTGCASERVPLQAMLLPPVDGKLALWINQPAYFAVVGVGPERGAEVLYQQTALQGVPASGYVYVPMRADAVPAPQLVDPDADYEQVYLVASSTPIDLSAFPSAARDVDPAARASVDAASVRSVLASSQVVDGYGVADSFDRRVCFDNRTLPYEAYVRDPFNPWRVYVARDIPCQRRRFQRSASYIAPARTFFTPIPRLHPPGKGVPPQVPPVEIKATERTMRYVAAQTASGWSQGETRVEYASHGSTSTRSESPPAHAGPTSTTTSSSSSGSARPH